MLHVCEKVYRHVYDHTPSCDCHTPFQAEEAALALALEQLQDRMSLELLEQVLGEVTRELSQQTVREVVDDVVFVERLKESLARDEVGALAQSVVVEQVTSICR